MRSITSKLKKMQLKPSLQIPSMDKPERIKRLKEHLALSKINHEEQIMKQASLKDAHMYCSIYWYWLEKVAKVDLGNRERRVK